MNLNINWSSAMATHSPFANGIGSAENVGKLNTTPPIQDDTTLRVSENQRVERSSKITMEDFLSTIRGNLTRLQMKDNENNIKDIEPLVAAFESTINQLEQAYGSGVAEMAMQGIIQGIEAGGASDANMTNTVSSVFNRIALDSTLEGKHIEFTKKITGKAPEEDSDWLAESSKRVSNTATQFIESTQKTPEENSRWLAGGLLRVLNAGTKFGVEGEDGLAKALSDFYYNDKTTIDAETGEEIVYSETSKKFILKYNEASGAYGIKLDTVENNSLEYFAAYSPGLPSEENSGLPSSMHFGLSLNEAANQGIAYRYLKSDWRLAEMQAYMMAGQEEWESWEEKYRFIDKTISGIIGGSIAPEVTEKMLEYEEKYLLYYDEIDRALFEAYKYNPKWQMTEAAPGITAPRREANPYASEEKFEAADKHYSDIRRKYLNELGALQNEIFAEYAAKAK